MCSVARRASEAGGEGSSAAVTLPVAGRRAGGRHRREAGLCDREVAEAICDLVGCIRLEHLLPQGGGEAVRGAAERGLLPRTGPAWQLNTACQVNVLSFFSSFSKYQQWIKMTCLWCNGPRLPQQYFLFSITVKLPDLPG